MDAPRDFTRSYAFELDRASSDGDGLTLTGYAAVFGSPTRIDSWEGRFDEVIAPGAFARTIAERTPVLQFDHGKHPMVGSIPIGSLTVAREDTRGLFVEARLHDNWLVEPVRDAIRSRSIHGMSFRFQVPDGGDRWEKRSGDIPLRTLLDVDVPELGPVVFPAYRETEVAVREDLTGRPDAWCAGGGDTDEAEEATSTPQTTTPSRARHNALRFAHRRAIK